MRSGILAAGAVIGALVCASPAGAAVIGFSFSGAGITGSGTFTVGPDLVLGDPPNALAITNMSGTFTDTNVAGIVNANITGVVPINPVAGDPLAPKSFSRFAVVNPPPPDMAISYDNLIYLDGSPIVCTGYPGSGGFLDVYGVLFTLDNGDTVDLWSNGRGPGFGLDYGAIVIDPTDTVIDVQNGGLTASAPEPAAISVLGIGLLGLGFAARRRRA